MQFFLYLCIAAAGGAGSLIFELVLFKILSLQLGTTHTALAMVLASYMAGLGLGAYFFGRSRLFSSGNRSILALTQGVAGLLVLSAIAVLRFLDTLIVSFQLSSVTEHIIIFAATLLSTLFIGGLVPLLYRMACTAGFERSRTIAWIYGLNCAGSIIGVLLATFLLIPSLGLFWTNSLSAGLFFSISLLVRFINIKKGNSTDLADHHSETGPTHYSRLSLTGLAATAGFCGLALEIIWVRILGTFLPNRAYSFGLILAIYLLGYSLGSMAASRISNSRRRSEHLLPVIFVAMGLLSLGTIVLVHYIPELIYSIRGVFITSSRQILLPPVIMSFLMVFPVTFLMGLVLPVLVSLYPVARIEIGLDVGSLFGTNIGFSVVGSLLAGFVGLPVLGAARTILIVVLLYTGAGLVILPWTTRSRYLARLMVLLISGGMLVVSIFGLLVPGFLPKPLPVSVGREVDRDDKLLFFKETAAGTITVVEDGRIGTRWSYINNSSVCGTTYDALKVVRMLAHLPLLAHTEPRQVLVIGFGLGVTAGNVLSWPVDQVDCIELCPELSEAAPLYEAFNHGVLRDTRLSLIAGDGRRWLKRTKKKYDVITCDPTHPVLGSGNLYTIEFFTLIKSRLTENGVFVQYYPFRYLTTDELKHAILTFQLVFPHCSLWLGYSHGVMLGCQQPLIIDPIAWQKDLTNNPRRLDLMKSSLSRSHDWFSILLMGPDDIREFCGTVQPVSDMKPILEYPRFDSVHPITWAENMRAVSAKRSTETVLKFVSPDKIDENFLSLLERFSHAQSLFIQGNIERHLGKIDIAMDLYLEARKSNWDDTEIRSVHEFLQRQIGDQRRRSYFGHD